MANAIDKKDYRLRFHTQRLNRGIYYINFNSSEETTTVKFAKE